ncbi:hypothetical protein C8J56DRAFT_915261, partial [Mycena floridula]
MNLLIFDSGLILLFSSWFNMMLFTIQISLSGLFLRNHRSTSLQKTLIGAALAIDGACTFAVFANTFMYLVLFPARGPESFPTHQLWPLPIIIMTTALSALFEHTFLLLRFWRLSRNKPITVVLSMLALGQLIFSFVAGIYVVVNPAFVANFGTVASTISVSLRTAADILLALALVIKLHSFETVFISTRQLIRRVSFLSLTSGLMCALTSTIMIALLLKQALGNSHHPSVYLKLNKPFQCLISSCLSLDAFIALPFSSISLWLDLDRDPILLPAIIFMVPL